MRDPRKTLLTGIAAVALVAGSGLASAQEPSKEKAPQSKEPHAATQTMNKAPGALEKNRNAQEREPTATELNRRAEESERANKTDKGSVEKRGAPDQRRVDSYDRANEPGKATSEQNQGAQGQQRNQRSSAEPGHERAQGAGNGTNVQLSAEQRTQIREKVVEGRGAPRVAHVNFDLTVGTVVPRGGVEIVPVPETLVEIQPAWQGFLYFVYEDEVVIVDPNDMEIVAVVPV